MHVPYTDEEGLDEDLKDLIDDNPIEEEGDEESEDEEEVDGEKRKHRDSDIDEDLSDEDYDLIQENLGIKIKRKVFSWMASFESYKKSTNEYYLAVNVQYKVRLCFK